jgi:hypothetical protein
MKLTRFSLLFAAAAVVLCAPFVSAQETGRKSLAITKITATSAVESRMSRQGAGSALASVVQALDAQVYDRVLNTRRFDVLERADADALARESSATGQAFAFNKADYILTITIDSFNDRMEEREFATLGRTVRARTVELSAVTKVIEVATQRALTSANIKVTRRDSENRSENTTRRVGEASDDLLIQAVGEMAQKIAGRVAESVYPARIIGKRDRVVTINRNDQSGIKVGQVWEVFALGDELVDPDTGERMMEEVLVGKVKITRVTPQSSQGESFEDLGIERGSVIRLLTDVDPEGAK